MILAFSISDLIRVPFGYLMDLLYQFTSNYGLALILFALLVKLILLPASAKSKKSMMKMSRLAPLTQAIQKKYENDPQKAQAEIQQIYKEEGASMMGGCLWSLLPLLLLFPLYTVIRQPLVYMLHLSADQAAKIVEIIKEAIPAAFLSNSYYDQLSAAPHLTEFAAQIREAIPELANTTLPSLNFQFLGINLGQIPSWQFWKWEVTNWASIGLFLLPVLSAGSNVLSMWISQKMNASVTTDQNGNRDESAAKANNATNKSMMIVMPLMSLFIGYSYPAALSLYWLVQGIFGIIQDVILTLRYRKIYDAEDEVKRKLAAQKAAEEAERERTSAGQKIPTASWKTPARRSCRSSSNSKRSSNRLPCTGQTQKKQRKISPCLAPRTAHTQKAVPTEPTVIAMCRTTLRSNLMEKKFIATGKDFDSAVQAALKELGLELEDVSVQLLERAKNGVFGFGARPCKVEITYETPDPAPTPALSAASRSKPKKAAPPAPPVQEDPKPVAPKAAAPMPIAPKPAEPKPAESKPETPAPRAPRAPRPERPPHQPKADKPLAPKPEKVFAPAAPGSVEEKIETFLKGLLERMGSTAVPHAWKNESEIYQVELVGKDLGMLIGRRGETLDAIQHLTNYAVNHNCEGRVRISVDAEDYRVKREESLRRYARKKAQQVLKQRRRTTLEPMNAYERHVIHAALQEMDNITTYSTGTDPNRRVIIEYVR